MEGRVGRSRGKTAGNTTLKAEARKNTILKKEGFGRGIQGGKSGERQIKKVEKEEKACP